MNMISHVSDCFKINGKQIIQMLEESEYVKFKNNERKIKSPFMIYANFESISMPEDNGKQSPEESYMNKYKKYVPWSYGYKLVSVDDKFSKYFKSYLGGDAVFNFINNMIEESKYCTDNMKTHLNKKLWMARKDNEDFKNSTKCGTCDDEYLRGDD